MEPERAEQYAYFMIRVRLASLVAAHCAPAGMIERLATGEKDTFASGEELIRLICRPTEADRMAGEQPAPTDG